MTATDFYNNFDTYVNAQVLLPQNSNVLQAANVIWCSTDKEQNPIGDHDPNPILNTRVYGVMFPGSAIPQHLANLNAKKLYENLDEDHGHKNQYIHEI